jgi:hypothetical protein
MSHFLAARTESNCSDHHCKNDSALHSLFSWSSYALPLLANRHVSAELHRLMTYLATASAESNSGDYSRDDDHALNVHGLLSYHVFGNRTYSGTGV